MAKSPLSEETPPKPPASKRPVRKRIQARYDRHMPDRWHHRMLIWAVFLSSAAIIAVQLLYPLDRALPLARVAGENVWWQNHEQLAEAITTNFHATKLKLVVDGQTTTEVPLASVGAEPNTEAMIEKAVDYPFLMRFVPFSIFMYTGDVVQADVYYTSAVLQEVSEEQAAQLSTAPMNARLAIENGMLIATAERRGSDVTAESVYKAISEASPILGDTTAIVVPAIRSNPQAGSKSLEAVRSAAESALGRQVVIRAGTHTFIPDDVTVASWLKIGTNGTGGPILELAGDKVDEYLDTIDTETGVAPGQTNINLTNGREISREAGSSGLAIDRVPLKQKIAEWLLDGDGRGEFFAVYKEVAPTIIYDNKYTATEEGLRTYIADVSKRMNVHIAIQQLDGEKWTASVRADESIPSASTYKLFVAKWLFDKMNKGIVQWDDPMLDTTVSTCFDRMTIASTNPCAESWLAQAGRSNVNQYLYDLGFSMGTTFTHPVATHTTANDLQKMMLGIYDDSLIDGANKERLLHSLSTHPYGYGIPTGSSGQVWDKVGFLWDYVHDTAIVKHPKGTYIMTIMTKGQSYATIANLTREIERIMYP